MPQCVQATVAGLCRREKGPGSEGDGYAILMLESRNWGCRAGTAGTALANASIPQVWLQ